MLTKTKIPGLRPPSAWRGRWSGICAAVLLAVPGSALATPPPGGTTQTPLFTDIAQSSGLDFVHFNGMSGELYYPEMVGAGGAVLDFDNDGDLDVFAIQGAMLGSAKKLSDARFPARDPEPRDRLFRNDLVVGQDGSREMTFVDVTGLSGIRGTGYGMGAAVGDFNNDGWVDLYVTHYGSNRLWRNNGDGTFADVTQESGTDDPRWSTSAAFFDYDRDGLLDLFVANYVDFSVERNPQCYATSTRLDYCGPSAFAAQGDSLFHNLGSGRFENVSAQALGRHDAGAGLGVVTADFNADGWIDLYVANDGLPNHLWVNQKNGRFVEDALLSGAAVNRQGRAEASMGVDAADIDNDGDEDLFMTHLMGETNTLYINDGKGFFEDRTREFGLAVASTPFTAFGTAWFDYNNDSWPDLMVLNGAVRVIQELAERGDPYPLHQPNQLFGNDQGGGFTEITHQGGRVFALSEVSRGAVFADLDNDGDTDVLVFNNNGRLRLLRNDRGSQNPWLGLRLLDKAGKADALGARVAVHREGKRPLWRRVGTDGSYCSANDPRVLVGLGDGSKVSSLTLIWPDGSEQQLKAPATGRYHTLRQSPRSAGNRHTSPLPTKGVAVSK